MSSPKLTDLAFLESFTKGDKVKMSRYIEMYLKNTSVVLDELYSDLENNALQNIRLKAHSIKPQAHYMGVSKLKAQLIEIEDTVKSGGTTESLKPLIDKAKATNDQAMTELKQFLKTD